MANEKCNRINFLIIIYFALTIFEAILNNGRGSILKLYGYLLVLAIFFIQYRTKGTIPLRIDKVFRPFLIWFAYACLSVFWSYDMSQGFDYILSMGNVFLLALVFTSIYWNKREIYLLFTAYGFSSLLFSILLIALGNQVHSATLRYTVVIMGTVYDPNVVVGFIAPGAILLLLLMKRKFLPWFVALPSVAVIVLAIFLTGSRGGVLAVGASVVFYLFAYVVKERLSTRKILILTGMIIAIIGVLYFLITYLDASIVNRVFHIDMTEGSSLDRIQLLKNAWGYFSDREIFGLGCGGLDAVSNNHGAHNMYMFVLADMGIVGGILFMFAILSLMYKVWRTVDWELTVVLVCTCCIIFFLDSYHAKYFWNTILFLGMNYITSRNYEKNMEERVCKL